MRISELQIRTALRVTLTGTATSGSVVRDELSVGPLAERVDEAKAEILLDEVLAS